ncbi:galactosyltransferase-related protein [Sphaerisporangium sp. NPDC005289]|uniref:glycosyltransferase n=1 Tax=Sphaerisporangium sp. NPDC005289 TaxID=3155247 RepID=UPI0033BDD8A1
MPTLRPSDLDTLATAVVDSIAVALDPDAPQSGLYYWECARPFTGAVVEAVRDAEDPAVRELGRALIADPSDAGRYAALREALKAPEAQGPGLDRIFDLAWQSECNNRLGHHVGAAYTAKESVVTVEELRTLPPGPGLPAGADPEVLIVVPFRDRDTGGARLRNLLACLQSLRDQSFPRERYQVTVVESDSFPRWRDVIEPYADNYLFAPKASTFNKSWVVNVGVVHSPGHSEVISILDADVLADREFVERNATRFERPGTMGHLTYRNMLCLDTPSSQRAIKERLWDCAGQPDLDRLRGYTLRRGPGCSLWVRTSAFHRIDGMDERYEGWGGEDIDFNYRFDFANAYDSYDDPLLHLRHPPASALREDGELTNAHIPPLSWKPEEPIGRIDRFAHEFTERAERGDSAERAAAVEAA